MTGLNRAGFYRWRTPRLEAPVEMKIRDEMQKIALESAAYGYRRITVELQKQGFAINHKRVLRMMREDNLLCVRRRRFVVTTDSRHSLPIYPNLAAQMVPRAINQLWVADITYIRLRTEFVYLAVVLDAFSRRVIGWALGRTLEAELAIAALRMALSERKPSPGLPTSRYAPQNLDVPANAGRIDSLYVSAIRSQVQLDYSCEVLHVNWRGARGQHAAAYRGRACAPKPSEPHRRK
jgi:transposase InsO family protein